MRFLRDQPPVESGPLSRLAALQGAVDWHAKVSTGIQADVLGQVRHVMRGQWFHDGTDAM